MRRRHLKCNHGISEINNNAVVVLNSVNRRSNAWGRLSYTGHVALFSSCSPLIFFHAEKTTELAAAIIPVMILHGLHTDSTYHSPLRETFVKDIREDFSNLVNCNLA